LQIENIGKLAIKAIGPDVCTRFRINELAADTHAIARFADAAFEDVAHAQFAGHLPHIDRHICGEDRGEAADGSHRSVGGLLA
jgi:hypothetical protein